MLVVTSQRVNAHACMACWLGSWWTPRCRPWQTPRCRGTPEHLPYRTGQTSSLDCSHKIMHKGPIRWAKPFNPLCLPLKSLNSFIASPSPRFNLVRETTSSHWSLLCYFWATLDPLTLLYFTYLSYLLNSTQSKPFLLQNRRVQWLTGRPVACLVGW